jgi:hypothetical protein
MVPFMNTKHTADSVKVAMSHELMETLRQAAEADERTVAQQARYYIAQAVARRERRARPAEKTAA